MILEILEFLIKVIIVYIVINLIPYGFIAYKIKKANFIAFKDLLDTKLKEDLDNVNKG